MSELEPMDKNKYRQYWDEFNYQGIEHVELYIWMMRRCGEAPNNCIREYPGCMGCPYARNDLRSD